MGRKVFASLLIVLLLMSASVATLGAAPVNNPDAHYLTLDCEGVEYEVLVASGNPAFVVGSTQRLIPHHFSFALEIDGEVVFEEGEGVGKGKKTGLQDRLVTCTTSEVLSADDLTPEDLEYLESLGIIVDDDTTIIGRITVQAMFTPAGP